jgi:excisionase family DNA binding protein
MNQSKSKNSRKFAYGQKLPHGTLPRMTKITIPAGTNAAIKIPAHSAKPERMTIERIGFSIDETAESLGVSVPKVLTLIKQRQLPTVRVGKRVIVSVRSLRDFVDGKTRKPDKFHTGNSMGCRGKGEKSNGNSFG